VKVSLADLAELTGAELIGDPDCTISNISALDDARETELSFVVSRKFLKQLKNCRAAALILPADLANEFSGNKLVHPNPYLAYARATEAFTPVKPTPTIHATAIIADDVIMGKNISVGPYAVLESGSIIADNVIIATGCVIGANCQIGEETECRPNVTIASDTIIGARSLIHSGAVIGEDGFGFAPNEESWYKIQQIGRVIIGDDVEIGANTTIDRAALNNTTIENGVKIDNLIQIGHNVHIGEHTAMAACSCVAGSTKIGKRCKIGGAVGINGHIEIADDTTITAKTTVLHSIKVPGGVYSSGTSAVENRQWRRNTIRFNQLDEMARKLRQLEKRLDKSG
jgi:UDP-3-O-[3-hydroxymyristoyl] glucosamine N-acyltransferase